MREQLNLTAEDGAAALRDHVASLASSARQRHGAGLARGEEAAVRALLADPEVVRFPTALAFDDGPLMAGEFAYAKPRGERPADGYTLCVHPCFAGRWDVVPLLVAYHVVAINYLDIATNEEAELFGATLLGMSAESYYARVCELADSIPGARPHDPGLASAFETASSGSCGGSCSCSGGS